ncbi:MAG: AAA family ATPase [Methanoregula sp.]|nr:AAA family ATPase [Methanoregula sp.]
MKKKERDLVMLKRIRVRNFKSVKELDLPLGRVTVLLGEPGTGKSNILEAFGLLSWCGQLASYGHLDSLKEYVRFQNLSNVFYDDCTARPIEIAVEDPEKEWQCLTVSSANNAFPLTFFRFRLGEVFSIDAKKVPFKGTPAGVLDYSGALASPSGLSPEMHYEPVKFYRFKPLCQFHGINGDSLSPPDGRNLLALVMGNSRLRDLVDASFGKTGQRLVPRPVKKTFEFCRPGPEPCVTFPYHVVSDTIARSIFYSVAVESNRDATVIFEEPEAHMHPSQTRALGEMIGRDTANQYIIATHSPYLLRELLVKTSPDQLAVYVTYCRDSRTRVAGLTGDNLAGLTGPDPISEVNQFIPPVVTGPER